MGTRREEEINCLWTLGSPTTQAPQSKRSSSSDSSINRKETSSGKQGSTSERDMPNRLHTYLASSKTRVKVVHALAIFSNLSISLLFPYPVLSLHRIILLSLSHSHSHSHPHPHPLLPPQLSAAATSASSHVHLPSTASFSPHPRKKQQ